MNVLRALDDPKLLGCGVFADSKPWSAWRIFLAAQYALPLIGDELDLFQRCTGQTEYNPAGVRVPTRLR